jgi:hypothetical protein
VLEVLDHEMLKDEPDQPEGIKGNLLLYITMMKLFTAISVLLRTYTVGEYLRTDPSISSLVVA